MGKEKEKDEIIKSKEFWSKLDILLKILKHRGINISKAQIAEEADIDPQQISRYKKGENIMPFSKFIKLSQFLSLSPNDLAFLFSPAEKAKGIEKSFQDWLYLNDIPYLPIRSKLFKGISPVDYILLIKDFGVIGVNIKYRESLSTLNINWPLDKQREFEKTNKIPVWFVFSDFDFGNQLKIWYWLPLSQIKEHYKINIKDAAIPIADANSLLNGIYKFRHIPIEVSPYSEDTELKKYFYIIEEAYNLGNDKIKIELEFCLRNIKNDIDEYKKSTKKKLSEG